MKSKAALLALIAFSAVFEFFAAAEEEYEYSESYISADPYFIPKEQSVIEKTEKIVKPDTSRKIETEPIRNKTLPDTVQISVTENTTELIEQPNVIETAVEKITVDAKADESLLQSVLEPEENSDKIGQEQPVTDIMQQATESAGTDTSEKVFEPVTSVLSLEFEEETESTAEVPVDAVFLEYERYACAFSSNAIEINGLYCDSFDPARGEKEKQTLCSAILHDTWGIDSYDTVKKAAAELDNGGDAHVYCALVKLLNDNPNKKVVSLIKSEGLTAYEGVQLFFAEFYLEMLGSKGIDAWTCGTQIALYRWAVGAGYISAQEAIETLKPLIDNFRAGYSSWEEYFARYIAGGQFSALSNGKYREYASSSQKALQYAKDKINFDDLPLAEAKDNVDDLYPLTIDMVLYTPTADALKWEKVLVLTLKKTSLTTLDMKNLSALLETYPAMPCIQYLCACAYINSNLDSIAINELSKTLLSIENTHHDSDLYFDVVMNYAHLLWKASRPQEGVRVLESLTGGKRNEAKVYYLLGCCYLDLSFSASTASSKSRSEQLAYQAFTASSQKNYSLSTHIRSWMKKYEQRNMMIPE